MKKFKMNLNQLLPKREIKFIFEKNSIVLWVEKSQNFKDIQQTIKSMFKINPETQIDLLAGKFYINEFLTTISFDKLCEVFFTNKFEVILASKNPMNFKDLKSISSEIKNLNHRSIENECKNHLASLENILEVEESTKLSLSHVEEALKEIETKAKLIQLEDGNDEDPHALKLEDEDDEIRELKYQLELEGSKLEQIEEFLERNFEKIINYKNLEKEALQIFKDNRKIIGNIYSNSQLIEDIKDANKKLEIKKQLIIHRKEISLKMVKKIINIDKNVAIDDIKLKFIRLYKQKAIMELISYKEVALYFPVCSGDGENSNRKLYNDGEILLREFEDKCDFGYFYNSQQKREQFSLNLKDRLLIVINKHIFLYELESNTMNWIGVLDENHKGGGLVYVPYDNLVYCISGIVSSAVETINALNDPEFDSKKSKTSLTEPRAYFGTFVQNDSKIYVMLGYNYMKNDFMTTIERLDTASPDKTWKELFFSNEFTVPKLVFISCLPTSNDKIHILGGVDENYFINRAIYVICLSPNSFEIEITNMALPFEQDDKKIAIARDNNKGFSCLFYQENCFVPLQTPVDDHDSFLFGLYDSKHNLHITNLNNFNYCIISRKEEKPKIMKNAFQVNNVYNVTSNVNENNFTNYNNQQNYDNMNTRVILGGKEEMNNNMVRSNFNLFMNNKKQ